MTRWNEMNLDKTQTGPSRFCTQCLFTRLLQIICFDCFAFSTARFRPAVNFCLGKKNIKFLRQQAAVRCFIPETDRKPEQSRMSTCRLDGDVPPRWRLATLRMWRPRSSCWKTRPETRAQRRTQTTSEHSASGHLHNLIPFGPLWTVTILDAALAARLPEPEGLSERRWEADKRGTRSRKKN